MSDKKWDDFDQSKFKCLQVVPRTNEDADKFIKRFLKKVRTDGILQEVYERSWYEKPSVKKRRKALKARFMNKNQEET